MDANFILPGYITRAQVGSTLRAEDWDATKLVHVEDGSIDRIVTDMPFGPNRYEWGAIGLKLIDLLDLLSFFKIWSKVEKS